MTDMRIYVAQDTLPASGENSWLSAMGSKRGELYVTDFFMRMVLEQRAYQVRAGTITTPLTGDVDITDTAAEACADAASGTTIIPVFGQVDIESLGGTLPHVTFKSVATVSSVGAAFVPLPMYSGGGAATSTARVAAAGGVTVTAEAATTTLRHFAKTVATAALDPFVWEPKMPPVLNGPRCFYLQVGTVTTGSVYFANFDFIELPTVNVS